MYLYVYLAIFFQEELIGENSPFIIEHKLLHGLFAHDRDKSNELIS